MSIKISTMFDAGSIDVVNAEHPSRIDLNLRADSHADIHQWFHFRLQGARDQAVHDAFFERRPGHVSERASRITRRWPAMTSITGSASRPRSMAR